MKRFLLTILLAASVLFTGCQAPDVSAAAQTSADSPATAETELTVASFLQNSYIEYAANEYMKQHEGVTVTINLYSSETERDLGKYQQTLNTAMMSGGGEDIIDVSKLNWMRLADNEMILDLNRGLELDDENYYMNILDGYLYRDKRMALPLNFTFEGFKFYGESPAANETATELTLENLQAMAEKYQGTAPFSGGGNGMDTQKLAIQHFYRDMDTFMNLENKTVNMNGGQFEEILTKIKNIADTVNPPEDQKTRLDYYDYESGEPYLLSQYLIYTPAMCSDGLVDYEGVFPLIYNGNATFDSVGYLPAINANTKNKELAFDFLQFLISKEIMMSPEQLFCTVNRNAVREKAVLTYESIKTDGFLPEGFTEETLENNIKVFDEIAARLNVPEYSDSNVYDFLYEDLTEFFEGNISAAEACGSLQSKLTMYLNE